MKIRDTQYSEAEDNERADRIERTQMGKKDRHRHELPSSGPGKERRARNRRDRKKAQSTPQLLPDRTPRPAHDCPEWHELRATVLFEERYCAICGSDQDPTVDHIIPLGAGGGNHRANLRRLCNACNHRKANQLPADATNLGLSPRSKSANLRIADHALLRYMQHQLGIDVEAIRQQLLPREAATLAAIDKLGNGTYPVGSTHRIVLRNQLIVSIKPLHD